MVDGNKNSVDSVNHIEPPRNVKHDQSTKRCASQLLNNFDKYVHGILWHHPMPNEYVSSTGYTLLQDPARRSSRVFWVRPTMTIVCKTQKKGHTKSWLQGERENTQKYPIKVVVPTSFK